MGPEFQPKMLVKDLSGEQIVRLHQLFRQAKFDDPSGQVIFATWISIDCEMHDNPVNFKVSVGK